MLFVRLLSVFCLLCYKYWLIPVGLACMRCMKEKKPRVCVAFCLPGATIKLA
jgi:hypothetical protein